ncbi:MAG TPA: hypothetical protein VER55_07970 [Ardenticatenaceae bacterium]|nr:hypothetical protein [Ardenticatenaceae bacterium]
MRKVVKAVSMLYLVALVALALLVRRATPAPFNQEIRGLALGSPGHARGLAYVSGRRLDCDPLPAGLQPFTTRCTIEIAGKRLELEAGRNPPGHLIQLGGSCRATYDGKEWPCGVVSRHVHVHWFAHLSDPLGLSASQMDALRRRYLIENLPAGILFRGMAVVAVATLVVTAATTAVWLRLGGKGRIVAALAALIFGVMAGSAVFVASVFLTAGLWD